MVDIERGVKIAGARSYILKNDAARLELALMHFALDRMVQKGFTPLIVPAMAREFCFIGNGQFPKGRDQVYAIAAFPGPDERQRGWGGRPHATCGRACPRRGPE